MSHKTRSDGDGLLLLPGVGGTAWAIWQVVLGDNEIDSLDFLLSDLQGEAWLAISDYSSGRWRFQAVHQKELQLSLSNDQNVSPFGNLYVALVVLGGSVATVEELVMQPVHHNWQVVTVDARDLVYPNQSMALSASLAVVDGHPAIAYDYSDYGYRQLLYIRSSTPEGKNISEWPMAPVVVDDGFGNGGIEWSVAMAVVDGNPAIAYTGNDTIGLKYARSSTSSGSQAGNWNQIVTVDAEEVQSTTPALAIVDGNPAIAYLAREAVDEFIIPRLKYVRSDSTTGKNGADWNVAVTVASFVDAFDDLTRSLAVVDGNPAICYADDMYRLNYVRSSTSTGNLAADWNQNVLLDAQTGLTQSVFKSSSVLAVVGGNPAISYTDGFNKMVVYVRSTSSTGESPGNWFAKRKVGPIPQTCNAPSMAIVNGNVAVCFHNYAGYALEYTRSGSPNGDSIPGQWDGSIEGVVNGWDNMTPYCTSLAEVSGRPAIAYTNGTELKYAILFD